MLSTSSFRVSEAIETLFKFARKHGVEKWILVIPLLHLLRGDSKPFEAVPLTMNPNFDIWAGLKGIKTPEGYTDSMFGTQGLR